MVRRKVVYIFPNLIAEMSRNGDSLQSVSNELCYMCFCCWRWRFNDAHIEYAYMDGKSCYWLYGSY